MFTVQIHLTHCLSNFIHPLLCIRRRTPSAGLSISRRTSRSANLISNKVFKRSAISLLVPPVLTSLFTAAWTARFLFSAATDSRPQKEGFEISGGGSSREYLLPMAWIIYRLLIWMQSSGDLLATYSWHQCGKLIDNRLPRLMQPLTSFRAPGIPIDVSSIDK